MLIMEFQSSDQLSGQKIYLKIFIILECYFNYLFKSSDSLAIYIQHYRNKFTCFMIGQYF